MSNSVHSQIFELNMMVKKWSSLPILGVLGGVICALTSSSCIFGDRRLFLGCASSSNFEPKLYFDFFLQIKAMVEVPYDNVVQIVQTMVETIPALPIPKFER